MTTVVVLIVGLLLGIFLSAQAGASLEIINLALLLTTVILLLMIGGLIMEIKKDVSVSSLKPPVRRPTVKRKKK